MAIKNYTTKIDAPVSIGEIQAALAKAGANKVMIDYDNGEPVAVSFGIPIRDKQIGFILPVNMDGVAAVLKKQNVKADRAQVCRIAWRNVRDWVLAQLALIEAGNVTMDEVFLPYMATKNGDTLYRAFSEGKLMLPE